MQTRRQGIELDRPKAKQRPKPKPKQPTVKAELPKPEQQRTSAEFVAALATIDELTLTVATLRTQLAEREAEPKIYVPLKEAAFDASVRDNRARVWHHKGLIDSRKDAGRIVATVVSIIKRRILATGK
jgi:vancomycin resistance protein YoaR